jgi:hypothetical protein
MPLPHLLFIHNSFGLLILDPHPAILHSFPLSLFDNSVLPSYYIHDDLSFTIAIQWFYHRAIQ